MLPPYEGGCACRSIRYRCTAEPIHQLVCNCRDCQRASGSGFAAVVFVPTDGVTFSGAAPKLYTVMSDTGHPMQRGFCSTCGSPVLIKKPERPYLTLLQAATLDDPGLFQPTIEIFTSRAPPWTRSLHDLPRLPDGPGPAFVAVIEDYFRGRTT